MGGAVPAHPEKITRVVANKAKIANFNDLWVCTRDLLKLNIFTIINYIYYKIIKNPAFFKNNFFMEIVDKFTMTSFVPGTKFVIY